MELFHGGCHGCTMQTKHGLGYCTNCQNFEYDWNLSSLNDFSKKENERLNKIREIARELSELKLTCEDCGDKEICDCAFDPYNTNGDCLAIK